MSDKDGKIKPIGENYDFVETSMFICLMLPCIGFIWFMYEMIKGGC